LGATVLPFIHSDALVSSQYRLVLSSPVTLVSVCIVVVNW